MGEKIKKGLDKVTTSKRFWVMMIAFFVDMSIYTYMVHKGNDPTAVATGIVMINAPVFAYLGVETYKPSKKKTDAELS